jgi:hypothetical protein
MLGTNTIALASCKYRAEYRGTQVSSGRSEYISMVWYGMVWYGQHPDAIQIGEAVEVVDPMMIPCRLCISI